ncbi:energy transducer TonB [Bizionia argentinensis JUB59]|uniref:Energy transducer TonB n=1 Tax=Bizionia argentinensis JUB59 TaxID=1046627 RepID=G2EBD9_9FLAO|nr:energy transducer TonB [Bizionia argentinensis]EGV44329.1 energy transducer TonB [Bizionia argentinensis JUB59]
MELKKKPNLVIGRNGAIYFAIGLNIMLFFTWRGLEYRTYDEKEFNRELLFFSDEVEEDIPITNLEMTPPPPLAVSTAPEVITIVEDTKEIEETVIESSESNQQDRIEEREIAIEEVAVEEIEEEVSVPFSVVENVPVFPGCLGKSNDELRKCFNAKINEHIRKHFKYPESALDLNIHGKVHVMFIIDTQGHVSGVKSRGPNVLLEREAERIIGLLPVMEPGKQRGKPVKVPYMIPINFQIE